MKFKLVILAFSFISLCADEITLNWLETQPKTYARDFYILQFLKQESTTSDDANNALSLVNIMNNMLFSAYVKKSDSDEAKAVVQCMQSDAKTLLTSYTDCIAAGLTLKKASKLDSIDLDTVLSKVEQSYPELYERLKVLNASRPFSKAISAKNDVLFDVYMKTSRSFRTEKLNYRIPSRVLKRIQNDKRIEKLIKLVVTNPKMNLAQKSFFAINDDKFSANTSFLLAINLITHNKIEESFKYLDNAYKKAYLKSDKDKVLFWKYQITQRDDYLKELLNSWDVNLYTLFAKDYFNKVFKGIIYDIKQSGKEPLVSFDRFNQFDWIRVIRDTKNLDLVKIKEYEKIFTKSSTKPHMTFLYNKYNRHKRHYFIDPYNKHLENYSMQRKVLINAIARQESQFIPSSISSAYAQGVMQIMPFLSKSLAKALDEPYDIYNMFKPEYSIRYANKHLNALEERFEHPLFIAYAYNGGGGFLSSILKNGLFEEGKYEPFLSMEKVPYVETREYGKKVLTNYVIYNNRFNKKKIKLTTLVKRLKKPTLQ